MKFEDPVAFDVFFVSIVKCNDILVSLYAGIHDVKTLFDGVSSFLF